MNNKSKPANKIGRFAIVTMLLGYIMVIIISPMEFLYYKEVSGMTSSLDTIYSNSLLTFCIIILLPIMFGLFKDSILFDDAINCLVNFAVRLPQISYIISQNIKLRISNAELNRQVDQLNSKLNRMRQIDCQVSDFKTGNEPGFIYILRREDGIYKIGKTRDIIKRIKQHEVDYGLQFNLVARFVVSDITTFERLALSMTNTFEYRENNRLELRSMDKEELDIFISRFSKICRRNVTN